MKNAWFALLFLVSTSFAEDTYKAWFIDGKDLHKNKPKTHIDSLNDWFGEGSVHGNIRYYYIETKKESSSAHSNAIGGQLTYNTAHWNGFSLGSTFMTTNGFALPSKVDTSTIGRDNGVRLEGSSGGEIAQDSFSALGEAYIEYNYKDLEFLYGRKVIKTPLIHAKDVRMLTSAVQGGFFDYHVSENFRFGTSYLTHFKQRTSDRFINIVEHALGDDTEAITGAMSGEVITLNLNYTNDLLSVNAYNYYAQDFLNALYLETNYKLNVSSELNYNLSAQYMNQMSIGNADTNLAQVGSVTGGKEISSNLVGLKAKANYKESSFTLAYSKVFKSDSKHDSVVTLWDGTPLYTNTITSNNLFTSNYGKALTADSVYIGGSSGVKLAYSQKYDFTGIKGFTTSLSYLYTENSRFAHNQKDYNAVIGYTKDTLQLLLKGIYVQNNTSASEDGTISSVERFRQLRVIANYKF